MPSKFNEFWRTIEGYQHHAALPITWRRVLGSEYESLRKMLVPTKEYGASYPSPYGKNAPEWEIVELPNGSFVAVNGIDDDPIDLEPAEAYLQKLHLKKFCKTLAELLGVVSTCDIDFDSPVIRLGNIRVAKSEYPVMLTLVPGRRYFSNEMSRLLLTNPQPFIIITGTRVVWDYELTDVLKQRNVQLLALDDITSIENGNLVATDVWTDMLTIFSQAVCPDNLVVVPDYEFVRRGGWFIRYEGTQTVLPGELFGAFYIQRLLMKPCSEVHVTDLLAEFVGDDKLRIDSGGQEIIDHEARQNYKKRLEELVGQRAEAEKDDDEAWLERIDSETEQIASELLTITGLGGKTRKIGDEVYNIRRRISKTINDAIAKIKENDLTLACHLTNSITLGTMMNYEPDREIDWRF